MRKSRFLALILALLMLLAAFPAQAAPETDVPTPPLMPSDNPKDYTRPFDDETLTSYTVKSPNPFAVVYEDPYFGRTMYFHHVKNTVCSYMDPEALGAAINALPKLPEYAGASETPFARFITVDEDDNYEKHIYELHTDCLIYDGKAYALTTEQYGALYAAFKKSLGQENGYSSYPYWLAEPRPRYRYALSGRAGHSPGKGRQPQRRRTEPSGHTRTAGLPGIRPQKDRRHGLGG